MKSGVILKDMNSAPAMFYAPGATNGHVPAAQSWSEDPAAALCFASKKDAETFANVFLPHHAPILDFIPYTEPA